MFTNLIESQSHVREFKRRSSFFLITVTAYAVILFAAGIVSVYAYDAQLEAQTSSLELLNWVPPIKPEPARDPQPARRPPTSSNSRTASQSVRPVLYESPSAPSKPPDTINVAPVLIPPARRDSIQGNYVADPIGPAISPSCVVCTGTGITPRVEVDNGTPPPTLTPPKPTLQRVSSVVLSSKALSLPQPPYPIMAKQIGLHGAVSIQILVDEQGRVLSAQVVSGHPILSGPAREAALRARFTPTILNGQPVKIQGVITYNFVMQ